MLIGLNDSTRPGCVVRPNQVDRFGSSCLAGPKELGRGVGFGRRAERGTRAEAGRAGRLSRLSVRALADTLVPIGNLLQTVMGAWRLSGCPAHEWMPGVRRIARCANGHSAFEWVSDAQMDARPRNLVPRPARRNLAFPTWRDESCQTEDSLTNMSFFWSRKTIFWRKFAVVNDSMSSVGFRKTHNPRSQNFQDAESPS